MAELPRKFSSFAIRSPLILADLEGYVLYQPPEVGAELERIKLSDLLDLFLEQIP